MAVSEVLTDYYAVLQVHPDADIVVIEAAYRQLMKKHHPDLAGDDPRRIAESHARATELNRAFGVLRDHWQRRAYDLSRRRFGTHRPPPTWYPSGSEATISPEPPANGSVGENSGYGGAPVAEPLAATAAAQADASRLPPALSWLASAYYLLPGPYEWEPGQARDLAATFLLPVVGTGAFLLATGRLTPLLGSSPGVSLLAWVVVSLLSLPLLRSLPRTIGACGPTVLLLTGVANPMLATMQIPDWLAWAVVCAVSLMLSARQYVFGVLPTLALLLLIARVS
jgi:DnaJ domain